MGAVNPSTLHVGHDAEAGPQRPVHSPGVRDGHQPQHLLQGDRRRRGRRRDGLYRKTSQFYSNPGYPSYNPTKAKALVSAFKAANSVSTVSLRHRHPPRRRGRPAGVRVLPAAVERRRHHGDATAAGPEHAHQQRHLRRVRLRDVEPVRWCRPITQLRLVPLAQRDGLPGGWGTGHLTALPAGTNIAGAVNFAHQADPAIEGAMLAALSAKPGSSAQRSGWQTVNSQFSKVSLHLARHAGERLGRQEQRAELGVRHGRRWPDARAQPRRGFRALGPDLEVLIPLRSRGSRLG